MDRCIHQTGVLETAMARLRSPHIILSILLAGLLVLNSLPASAATNAVLGGVGGFNNGTLTGGDGSGTAQITLNSVNLALVKQARDLSGTVLPGGSNVSPGQEIYFVFYVDNTTSFTTGDIRITDFLNEAEFTYVSNSLETTTVPSGSNDAAIWAGAWTPLTDNVGGPDDIASITDSGGPAGLDRITVGSAAGQANQQLDIPGLILRAIRFRVTVK